MLALHGVVHLVNSCHINIVHNNVECSTQAYNAGVESDALYALRRPPFLGAWLCAFTI